MARRQSPKLKVTVPSKASSRNMASVHLKRSSLTSYCFAFFLADLVDVRMITAKERILEVVEDPGVILL